MKDFARALDDARPRRGRQQTFATRRRKGQGGVKFTNDELLDELRACAKTLGRTPGAAAFDDWIGFNASQLYGIRFGTWRQACELAGLTPNRKPRGIGERRYSEEDIAAAYERIRAKVGRIPTYVEWKRERRAKEPGADGMRYRHHNRWIEFVDEMEGKR